MTIRTTVVIFFGLVLVGCDPPENPSTARSTSPHAGISQNRAVDVQVVKAFFRDLGDIQYSVSRDDIGSDERLGHVFQWVRDAIPSSQIRDYEIKVLRFSTATTSSESAYELKIHQARGFVQLSPGRVYVQLHAIHDASDPEFHGVIDGEGPTLLSFWGDGA